MSWRRSSQQHQRTEFGLVGLVMVVRWWRLFPVVSLCLRGLALSLLPNGGLPLWAALVSVRLLT